MDLVEPMNPQFPLSLVVQQWIAHQQLPDALALQPLQSHAPVLLHLQGRRKVPRSGAAIYRGRAAGENFFRA